MLTVSNFTHCFSGGTLRSLIESSALTDIQVSAGHACHAFILLMGSVARRHSSVSGY